MRFAPSVEREYRAHLSRQFVIRRWRNPPRQPARPRVGCVSMSSPLTSLPFFGIRAATLQKVKALVAKSNDKASETVRCVYDECRQFTLSCMVSAEGDTTEFTAAVTNLGRRRTLQHQSAANHRMK